jgi:hypothetical protein
MKHLLLLLALSAQAEPLKLSITHSNGLATISFPAQAGRSYSLVRYDINNQYYDMVTNTVASTNVVSFTVNPLLPSDEDQPAHSGQCIFYVVETKGNE